MNDTRDKLDEAKYFVARMIETNCDKNGFRYNLSAFLSAFCSVIDFMNIEYQKFPGFVDWYKEMKRKRAENQIAIFFDEQRNKTTHVRPVSARTHQNQMNIPTIDLTKLDTFSITAKINEDGIMNNPQLMCITEEGTQVTEEFTVTTLWIFSDLSREIYPEDKDVVSHCEEQLAKLEISFRECEDKFAKK